jgi:uncharacterized ion transporter superfamily protein YfcC
MAQQDPGLTERPEESPQAAPEGSGDEASGQGIRFPQALTVLAIILVVVWVAAFFIPSGVYERTPEGDPIPGSYQQIPECSDAPEDAVCIDKSPLAMFQYLWVAPPNGLYGIEDEAGTVAAFNSGDLYGAAQIFLFVLAVGAFITVTMRTGAITAGIKRLALRFRQSPTLLIAILMVVFALGGTTYGMWEETLGFYVLLVALTLAMGFDRMVGAAIILLGAGSGIIASTVNPFATGVASDAAGIPLSDGLVLRVVMWLVLVPIAIAYVLWYARRVAADPSKSVIGIEPATAAATTGDVEDVPPLSGRQKAVLIVFLGAFLVMIYGFIPWDDIWSELFGGAEFPLPQMRDLLGDFYFTEASMLFLVAAVLIGLIAGFGEKGTVEAITAGAADFLGAALVIVLARAITVVMKNTYIIDTILDWMEGVVEGRSTIAFAELAWLVNIPIAFLVPSSSGHAALVMPILAPLADFAEVARSIAVTAYQSASGFVNLVTPTSAIIMGGLALAKIGYDRYLRFVTPFLGILLIAISVFVAIGTYFTA